MTERTFTIDELTTFSKSLLPSEHLTGWSPSARKIRYYTTLGLVDRPAGPRGRKNRYTGRQLLQLLAIKLLQHEGRTLEEIGGLLEGQSDHGLLQLTSLPPDWIEHLGPTESALQKQSRRRNFWKPQVSENQGPAEFDVVGIEIEPGLTLLIDRRQHPHLTAESLAASLPGIKDALLVSQGVVGE